MDMISVPLTAIEVYTLLYEPQSHPIAALQLFGTGLQQVDGTYRCEVGHGSERSVMTLVPQPQSAGELYSLSIIILAPSNPCALGILEQVVKESKPVAIIKDEHEKRGVICGLRLN